MRKWMFLSLGLAVAVPSMCLANAPLVVNFSILGAVVGPCKWTGAPWDGPGKRNPKLAAKVTKLMKGGKTAVPRVIKAVDKLGPHGAAAPDVIGYVIDMGPTTMKVGATKAATRVALATKHDMMRNSYMPRFHVTYQGWPVLKHSRFRVILWDADRKHDESMGVVTIGYKDIANAVKAGKPYWVDVASQSYNQILLVKIRASKAAATTPARIVGPTYTWR